MKHYRTPQWIDFARQVIDSRQAREMKQHLDDGCDTCHKNLQAWRQVVNFAQHERQLVIPEDLVRPVRANFALRKLKEGWASGFDVARLVFDSSQQAVAMGVRSGSISARQLLYRSGSICIDMRMQPRPGTDAFILCGQLLDSARPTQGIGDVPVSLFCKGGMVSQKKTSDVGEFDFRFGALRQMQLVFGLPKQRAIVVPVPDADSGLSAAV